jgi:hypothetical protein
MYVRQTISCIIRQTTFNKHLQEYFKVNHFRL